MSEFTAADFEGKTPEELAELANGKVLNLVANKDEILSESKGKTSKIKELEVLLESERESARVAQVEKEQELLKAQGDMEGYKKSVLEESAKREAELKEVNTSLLSEKLNSKRSDYMSQLLKLGHPEHMDALEDMLSNRLNISYNDDNAIDFSMNNRGEVMATNFDDAINWVKESPIFKPYLIGVDSGGAGVTQQGGVKFSAKPNTKDAKVNAAIATNPALASLPRN